MELKAPSFWHYMLRHLFKVESARLREELWRGYPKSTALVWHLMRCQEPAATKSVVYERAKVVCQLLDPGLMMRAAEALAPAGKARPRELRQFEQAVLNLVDKDGSFIWLKEEQAYDQRRIAGT